MTENICNKYHIKLGLDKSKHSQILSESSKLFDKVYSIFVNKVYSSGLLSGYNITLTVYDNESYNTIDFKSQIDNILKAIEECDDKYKLYFAQPSLDLMYNLYYNYTYKLSLEIIKRFPEYLLDDIIQICAAAILRLYNAGYYLNKRLIRKATYNDVYQEHIKHNKDVQTIHIIVDENDDKVDLLENLKDSNLDHRRERDEQLDGINRVMSELKPLIIQAIGERRYKNLIDNQANYCCNQQNYNDIKLLARTLKKYGYDLDWLHKQLGDR